MHSGYAFRPFIQADRSGYSFRLFMQAIHSSYSSRPFIQAILSGDSFSLCMPCTYSGSNFIFFSTTAPAGGRRAFFFFENNDFQDRSKLRFDSGLVKVKIGFWSQCKVLLLSSVHSLCIVYLSYAFSSPPQRPQGPVGRFFGKTAISRSLQITF